MIKDLKKNVEKARKDTLKTEKILSKTQEEVVSVAEKTKGKKKKNLTEAARDLEKAVIASCEAAEATEEAELKVKETN